jgi:anti-sigma B factor antagonist
VGEAHRKGQIAPHTGVSSCALEFHAMTVIHRAQLDSYLPVPFDVALDSAAGRTLVQVRGELDVASAPTFGRYLDLAVSRPEGDVIIDFANVTFVDGHGLAQVVRVFRVIRDSGRKLAITSPSPMARKLLEIVGLDGLVSDQQPIDRSRIPLP